MGAASDSESASGNEFESEDGAEGGDEDGAEGDLEEERAMKVTRALIPASSARAQCAGSRKPVRGRLKVARGGYLFKVQAWCAGCEVSANMHILIFTCMSGYFFIGDVTRNTGTRATPKTCTHFPIRKYICIYIYIYI